MFVMQPCSAHENITKTTDGAKMQLHSQLNGTGFGEKTWRDAAGMAKTRKSKMASTFLNHNEIF